MNPRSEKEHLLSEVLAEGQGGDFHAALLSDMLRRVRRRRRMRAVQRAGGTLLAVVLLLFPIWTHFYPSSVSPKSPCASGDRIANRPLAENAVVRTSPFATDCIIKSVALTKTFTTQYDVGNYTVINDDQLLALIAPRAAALVRIKDGSARLVFVNPQDEYGFPIN